MGSRNFLARYGLLFAVAAAVFFLFLTSQVTMILQQAGPLPFGVFGTFWASGDAVRHHLNPYVWHPLVPLFHPYGPRGPGVLDVNLNPPAMLPLFAGISHVVVRVAAAIHAVESVVMFFAVAVWFAARYGAQRRAVLWLLSCAATISTVVLQQNYEWLLLLAAVAFVLLEEQQDVAAGVCLGLLCAFKPNFLVWPALLLLAGRRKPVLPMAATFAAAAALPVWMYGKVVYSEWIASAHGENHWLLTSDVSLAGTLARWGVRPLGVAVAVVVLAGVASICWRKRPGVWEVSGLAVCAAILCAPLGWVHYVLAGAPLLLARRWTAWMTAGAVVLWVPVGVVGSHTMRHLAWYGSFYVVGMLLLLIAFVRAAMAGTRAEA